MNKSYIHIAFSLIVFTPLFLTAVILSPSKADAFSLTSPFGGKVEYWLPEAPGCAEITAAISTATLGTVNVTIEQLEVGGPKGGTFGILRVDGLLIPGLTRIYEHALYQVPGNWVLGSSFDLCKAILGNGKIGKAIKKVIGKKVANKICNLAGEGCPLTNLVHKMGTSLIPSL